MFSGFGSGFAPSLHPHQQLRPPLISPTSTTSSVESVSAPGFGSAFHNDNNILNGFGAIGAAPASSSFSSTSSIASGAAVARNGALAGVNGVGPLAEDGLNSLLRSPILNDAAAAAAAAAAASAPPPITASLTGGPLIKDVGGVTVSTVSAANNGVGGTTTTDALGGSFGSNPVDNVLGFPSFNSSSPFLSQFGGGAGIGAGFGAIGGPGGSTSSLGGGLGMPFGGAPFADPLFAPLPPLPRGNVDFMTSPGDSLAMGAGLTVSSASAAPISAGVMAPGLDISGSKLLPQIVAANRERNDDSTTMNEQIDAKNILDGFKNLQF